MHAEVSIASRMRTLGGHLRAVDRLLAEGRTREAIAQLRAVRAALGTVVRCLAAEVDGPAARRLLALFRAPSLSRHQ